MKTETTVTRFVTRDDLVTPQPTLVKAKEEAKDYVWQRSGNGHYVCQHGDTAHIIITKGDTIGCSCGDWTHRCKDNEGCKHVAAFLKRWRMYPPDRENAAAEREKDVEAAMDAGWQKDHPEVVAELPPVIPPDPEAKIYTRRCKHCDEVFSGTDLDKVEKNIAAHLKVCGMNSRADPEPEKSAEVSVTCRYCKMGATKESQVKADEWLHDHEVSCAKNPANQKTAPSAGMVSAPCQYCGKTIKRKLAADLKLALEIHEESCTDRPKEQEQEAVDKENLTTETQPEEEKKMSEDKPTWNQAAWDSATQGNFASYDENGVAVVLFTENDFGIGKPDQWGRTVYEFAVIQHNTAVILSVGSIRLMNALKAVLPLEGKKIKITRVGEGTGTQYRVEDVTEIMG